MASKTVKGFMFFHRKDLNPAKAAHSRDLGDRNFSSLASLTWVLASVLISSMLAAFSVAKAWFAVLT